MGVFAYKEPSVDVDAPGLKHLYLFEESFGIDYNAVPYYAYFIFVQYAGWYEVEYEFIIIYYNGMAGVIPSLIPYDKVNISGKYIYDFALTLITPLRTQNYYVCHGFSLSSR